MNCEHEHMDLIYSDHDTGYIDISWCPDCGALEFKDEDDYQFRTVEAQQQDPAVIEWKCTKCGLITINHEWEYCPACGIKCG